TAVTIGNQKGLWIGREVESVGTACQADDGTSGAEMRTEQHDVFVFMLYYGSIVNGLYRVRDVGFGKDWIVGVPSDDVWLSHGLFASSSKTAAYARSYPCTIVSMEKHCWTR